MTDHEKWIEAIEEIEKVDMLLDATHVPGGGENGLSLLARVALLAEKCTLRSKLAYELFKLLDKDYGQGLRNGYWPDLKDLWDRARKEFEVK